MRDLLSNTRDIWYALYQGKTKVVDENGDYTGETAESYSKPVKVKLNLSATRGTQGFTGTGLSYDYFGADVKYDLILSTCKMNLGINEYTLVWTRQPVVDAEGYADPETAQFRVTAVAAGLHHMKYAIRSRNLAVDIQPTGGGNG